MPRTCIFCETPLRGGKLGNKSDEHIIPKWLQVELGVWADLSQEITTCGDDQEQLRSHNLLAFVCGNVCRSCNEGWMSRLEVAVKPTLMSLVRQERSVTSLSAEEAKVISFWAAKTAITYLNGCAAPIIPPLAHCREIYFDQMAPAEVYVAGSDLAAGESYGVTASRKWRLYSDPPNFDLNEWSLLTQCSYKVTLLLERLMLTVLFQPVSYWWIGLNPNVFHILHGDGSKIRWVLSETKDLVPPTDRLGIMDYVSNEAVVLTRDPTSTASPILLPPRFSAWAPGLRSPS